MPYPHHAHSIDRWDDATGSNLYEHLAGVNDLLLAQATFEAAVKRWPHAKITLRNGARIIGRRGRRTIEPARACYSLAAARTAQPVYSWPEPPDTPRRDAGGSAPPAPQCALTRNDGKGRRNSGVLPVAQ
jgi:hypothetical protein